MLDDKICEMRGKLNNSIIGGEDYEIIYNLSVQLDELIAEFYRRSNTLETSNMETESTKERITVMM